MPALKLIGYLLLIVGKGKYVGSKGAAFNYLSSTTEIKVWNC